MFEQLIKARLLRRSQYLPKFLFGTLQFGMQRRSDGLHDSSRLLLTFLQDFVDFFALFFGKIEIAFHATQEIQSHPTGPWPRVYGMAHN